MFLALSHIMFYVENVDASIDWYIKNLGFERVFSSKYYGSVKNSKLNLQFDFHLTEETEFSRCLPPVPYFSSDDIDSDVENLKAKGIAVDPIRSEENSPRFTSFQDCDGNWLGIVEKV